MAFCYDGVFTEDVLLTGRIGLGLNMRTHVTYIRSDAFPTASLKSILNNRSSKIVLFTHY